MSDPTVHHSDAEVPLPPYQTCGDYPVDILQSQYTSDRRGFVPLLPGIPPSRVPQCGTVESHGREDTTRTIGPTGEAGRSLLRTSHLLPPVHGRHLPSLDDLVGAKPEDGQSSLAREAVGLA